MSRLLLSGAALAVALIFAPAARAADEPKDIITKAIKAHGGEELLTKNKAARTKAKGKINIGGNEIEFTQQTAFMVPDKFKDVMELKVGDKSATILTLVNGDKITLEVDGKEMPTPDGVKDSFKQIGQLHEISQFVPLIKDKKYELTLIGEDKVEGKKVVGVRVSAKNQKDVNVFFDKETGLLAKMEFRGAEPGTGKEVNEERIITEYAKSKSGVPHPKKIVVKHDGKVFVDAEILELTTLEKIDDSEFKK
jgi:hypothetical protein